LSGERTPEREFLERLAQHPVLLMRCVRAGKRLLSTKIISKEMNIGEEQATQGQRVHVAGACEAQFRQDLKIRFVVNTGEILIKDGAPQRAKLVRASRR
jgi:hypothetical protein